MTARDTIAAAIHEHLDSCDCGTASLYHLEISDAAIGAIRGMPPDELAELRPDIATEFYILREQAAMRGQYLLTTLRAHHAHQAEEDQP